MIRRWENESEGCKSSTQVRRFRAHNHQRQIQSQRYDESEAHQRAHSCVALHNFTEALASVEHTPFTLHMRLTVQR